MVNRIIYFRTMYNSAIRSIDLRAIDFSSVHYQAVPMDVTKQQPVEPIPVKWRMECSRLPAETEQLSLYDVFLD